MYTKFPRICRNQSRKKINTNFPCYIKLGVYKLAYLLIELNVILVRVICVILPIQSKGLKRCHFNLNSFKR
ncbi:hypothetical protein HanIR_Chr11g0509231 [Helianthus annuus]|nr:hypothetical protein HanIR_Chr11g0509231 [Helianthus annuus]